MTSLWRAREGATAVEAAFVLPLLLLLLLGLVEFGRIAWTEAALDFAVQEAARCAVVRPGVCGTPAQTADYAAGRISALAVPASAFAVTTQACGTQVRAEVTHEFVAYRLFGTAPKLTAQVCRA